MTISAEILKTYIARIERMEEEKKNILIDIAEIYQEAKSNGFDPKIIKKVISIRKMDIAKREQLEMELNTYLEALGMTETIV